MEWNWLHCFRSIYYKQPWCRKVILKWWTKRSFKWHYWPNFSNWYFKFTSNDWFNWRFTCWFTISSTCWFNGWFKILLWYWSSRFITWWKFWKWFKNYTFLWWIRSINQHETCWFQSTSTWRWRKRWYGYQFINFFNPNERYQWIKRFNKQLW